MKEDVYPPKNILVATDLSAHSDRALDRGLQLAAQWGAKLTVLYVVEQEPIPTGVIYDSALPPAKFRFQADEATRLLRYDIDNFGAEATVLTKVGDPVHAIMEVAHRELCDLVVIGTVRSEGLGRPILGKVAEHIVRKCPTSVLVVKTRPRGAYKHVLVGTDLTEESRDALTASLAYFPNSSVMLMRAFEGPYRFLLSEDSTRHISDSEAAALNDFLDKSNLATGDQARVHTTVENGQAFAMLSRYAENKGADLTVVGSFNRGMLFHVVLGGNTKRIVDAAANDVLVIRATRDGSV
jgi:nucleotide-binding universal stress UspA family protein